MGSSKIRRQLLGNTSRYEHLLSMEAKRLAGKYPDRELARQFAAVPAGFVSIAPMALCEAALADMGLKTPDRLLVALALINVHISTHDDVVDETPETKSGIAAMVYAGNITLIEGMQMLVNEGYENVLDAAMEKVKVNHLMQRRVIDYLWKEGMPTRAEYLKGIRHIISWVSIGIYAALEYAGRTADYGRRMGVFCENYGLSIQFMDDMREMEEDSQHRYWSLPIIKARTHNLDISSNEVKNRLADELKAMILEKTKRAATALPAHWDATRRMATRLYDYASKFSYE